MNTSAGSKAAILGAMLVMGVGCAKAPVSVERGGASGRKDGVLVMAHGGDAEWNRTLSEAVAPLRERYPVEVAFGMAVPSAIEKAVARLEAQGVRRVAVVRLFISGESFLPETEHILGLRPDFTESDRHTPAGSGHCSEPARPIRTNASFILSNEGVADSPLIDAVLADRVKTLSRDPSRESVLILAHGPGDDAENERWLARMRKRAAAVGRLGPFREVRCETLREDWPDKRGAAEQRIRQFVKDGSRDEGRVIVVPFRVAGFGPYKEVLEGLDYVADGRGFCPHPSITRWIDETAERCLDKPPGNRQARGDDRYLSVAEEAAGAVSENR